MARTLQAVITPAVGTAAAALSADAAAGELITCTWAGACGARVMRSDPPHTPTRARRPCAELAAQPAETFDRVVVELPSARCVCARMTGGAGGGGGGGAGAMRTPQCRSPMPRSPGVDALTAALRALRKGGAATLLLHSTAAGDDKALLSAGTLAGLTGVATLPIAGDGNVIAVTGGKPAWDAGAAGKLTFKRKADGAAAGGAGGAGLLAGVVITAAPKASLLGGGGGGAGVAVELVDEVSAPSPRVAGGWGGLTPPHPHPLPPPPPQDALLADDVLAAPTTAAAAVGGGGDAAGCAPKRRACKNCTCGRAEAESKVTLDTEEGGEGKAGPPTSSCGNVSEEEERGGRGGADSGELVCIGCTRISRPCACQLVRL
jgi:hypothetical protein